MNGADNESKRNDEVVCRADELAQLACDRTAVRVCRADRLTTADHVLLPSGHNASITLQFIALIFELLHELA